MKSSTTATLGGLVGRLFLRPVGSSRPAAIIAWWERRRIAYNLIVGLVGAVTHTYHGEAEQSARVRLISARKATKNEKKQYQRK